MSNERLQQAWRDIILYGRNTATYKFALGHSLLELAGQEREVVSLEELAVPFGRHMVEHARLVPRQATNPNSSYIALCLHYAEGRINETELHSATLTQGFRYVIDAFPKVDTTHAAPTSFYVDERTGRQSQLRLTDELLALATSETGSSLVEEVEARWQLVERTWESRFDLGEQLLVAYDQPSESLKSALLGRRRPFSTSVRPALNGYQRGHCFYCYGAISVLGHGDGASHVDHFLPFVSVVRGAPIDVDNVWNLVLACAACNHAKGDRLPGNDYLPQLVARNEWLVESNHPLKETIIAATGRSSTERARFLRRSYEAVEPTARWSWRVVPAGPYPFQPYIAA